jgi:hypothetical protein
MQAFGFQEGNVEVVGSVVAIHQFPPNATTGIQSDAFTAMRWTIRKLDEDWKPIEDLDNEVITIRLGKPEDMRPGTLQNPSDMDEEPEDLGNEVDTEGNALFVEPDRKVSRNWGELENSLRKCGFKPEIVGRGYAPDFEGMKAHFKTIPTGTYADKKTGEERKAFNLFCDRIHTYPYDVKKGKAGKAATGKAAAPVSAGKKAGAVSAPADNEALTLVQKVLSAPSDKFKDMLAPGKAVKRGVFQMQAMSECIRQKVPVAFHKSISELLKDDEQLIGVAAEVGFVVDVDEGTVTLP